MCAFITTLAGVDVVGFLIKDVVDAVDQKVEWQGHPNKNWQHAPVPEVAGKPHTHH